MADVDWQTLTISIHALRKESDPVLTVPVFGVSVFQSTLSVRRATFLRSVFIIFNIIISIHALRKESD